MGEELNQPPLRDRIRSIVTVIGLGEGYKQKIDLVLQQLGDLNCFDGDPQYLAEFKTVIEEEINRGAERVGIIGSRASGTQQPQKSDLDVVIINPRVNKNSPTRGLKPLDYAGTIVYWGSKTPGLDPRPRIHINRYPKEDPSSKPIIRNAVWVWAKK